jgi:hypothetical protein
LGDFDIRKAIAKQTRPQSLDRSATALHEFPYDAWKGEKFSGNSRASVLTFGDGWRLALESTIQISDSSETASSSLAGSLRYRTDSNNSYLDMCMQTGASSYSWVNIKTNTW